MGKRGPAPDPIPLKILKGIGNGKDQAGYPIPAAPPFERGIPDAPPWLTPDAREVWDRVAPTLDRLDLLKPEDREAFTCYCEAWATYRAALKEVRTYGLTIESHKTGMQHKNPSVTVMETAANQLLRFAQQFGLTPVAEVALAKPPKPAEDSDDRYGAGGQSAAV
jgi:P27 family predicted phage terminase small subunit